MLITPEEFKRNFAFSIQGKTEVKNGFTYLKWAYALKFLKENYPEITVRFVEDDLNLAVSGDNQIGFFVRPYLDNGKQTSSPLFYPVLDFRNKPVKQPNVFDINSSRMRGMVKTIAIHTGYGMCLFTGDEYEEIKIPEENIIPTPPYMTWRSKEDALNWCCIFLNIAQEDAEMLYSKVEAQNGKKAKAFYNFVCQSQLNLL